MTESLEGRSSRTPFLPGHDAVEDTTWREGETRAAAQPLACALPPALLVELVGAILVKYRRDKGLLARIVGAEHDRRQACPLMLRRQERELIGCRPFFCEAPQGEVRGARHRRIDT
eukprot:CAMPEP_0202761204 /NCGR_PEP_ID=MMETSP1388-20130828/19263_2 /ASSEMBLY_ACC=CAM_ASM_000864 /TAXON_ID=37098 /ORGANISM="Isochrysis sp, Strain CCMP1244" /LENGTH=115 /DNA_ID=CAMNT_0049429295 /DNA_START=227 /DNA_END=573 /DNA_ORIENTATION=-